MIQATFILILLQLLESCPYKNYFDNVLPQESLIQITQYKVSEENTFSFGFNFWIQFANFISSNAKELLEEPFNHTKEEKGQIIFRIYQEEQLVLLIYITEIELESSFFLVLKSHSFKNTSIDYFLKFTSGRLSSGFSSWIMVLVTTIPHSNEIIIEMSDFVDNQNVQILDNILLRSNLFIVLGGHCYINDDLNYNIFQGRITKLNIISPAFWNEELFRKINIYCRIPEKFIQSFGTYTFSQNPCFFECETCLEGQPELCTSCDGKLNRVLTSTFNCICSPDTIIQSTGIFDVFICVPVNIYSAIFEIIEVPITKLSCQFGYFLIQKNDEIICILCPNYSDDIVCIECLRYVDSWYQQPVCKSDFILIPLQQDNIYQYRGRLSKNFEAYLIDDFNQLSYLNGVEDYCDEEQLEQACFEYGQNHQGRKPYVKCKKGFLPNNGQCEFQIETSYLQLIECLSGQYYFEGNCLACPIGCGQCNYNKNKLTIQCNFCQLNFFYIQNQCMKCGQFCKKCILFNNEITQKPYLKCIKCDDDSKYFQSFDGINCLKNLIKNCQHAFQVYNSDLMTSTLDYDFIPQFNSQIETHCAKCDSNYIFIRSTKECFLPKFVNCFYGIADQMIYDEQEQEQLVNFLCIIAVNSNLMAQEFQDCSKIIKNCFQCQKGLQNINLCITCEKGYYKSRINGKCYKCYLNNCELCVQQDLQEEDGWKENIRPYYQFIINKTYKNLNLRLFSEMVQASKFQLICSKCGNKPYTQLFKGKCQSFCESECIRCEVINDKVICNLCSPNYVYNSSVQYQGKCILCNENCKACFVRSLSEISLINPFYQFNNSFENYFSNYQCFKYQKIQQKFYDAQIGEFIDCKTYTNGCKKQLTVKVTFTCQTLNNNLFDLLEFKQIISDNKINTIVFEMVSTKPLICKVHESLQFQQMYSNIIFSVINVKLIFNFTHSVIWEIGNNITFVNFNQIDIYGLQINLVNNNKKTKLEFQSLDFSQISFTNFSICRNQNSNNIFQINIYNSTKVLFINCSLNELVLSKQKGIFIFYPSTKSQSISIGGLAIINCKFQLSSIFYFQLNSKIDYIVIQVFIAKTFFLASELFFFDYSIFAQKLYIHDCIFLDTEIINSVGLIKTSNFQQFIIQFMYLKNLTIENTDFLYLNPNSIIENIFVLNSTFLNSSILIQKQTINTISETVYQFFNITFVQNFYSINTKFIALRQLDLPASNVSMTKLSLLKNRINQQFSPNYFLTFTQSLIILEVKHLYLNQILIQRAYGLIEISVANSKYLRIINSTITQDQNYKIFGLHANYNCLSSILEDKIYPIAIFIYSAQFIELSQIIITQFQTVNYPVIFYESEQKIIHYKKEEIYLNQLRVTQNLIIQTQIDARVSIFMFSSTQQFYLVITNSTFSSNILKFYTSIQITNSALLFSFELKSSQIALQSSGFESNLVLNGNNSIIFMKSQSIQILDCSFSHNNYFSYEILKPYLFWTTNETIYLDDLENFFSVQSISGNGYYCADEIEIASSKFSYSEGTQGAGIYLQCQQISSITLGKLTFENLLLNFYTLSSQGCAIYIYGSEESQLKLKIENIKGNNIFSNKEGGLVRISSKKCEMFIEMNNIQLLNVYSKTGQLIYFSAVNQEQKTQVFQLKDINVQNSAAEFNTFLSYFTNLMYQNNSNNNIHLKDFFRNIIHLEKVSLVSAQSIIMKNLVFESPLYLFDVGKMTLLDIQLMDSILFSQGIYINPNQFSSNLFVIENSTFANLTFRSQILIANLSTISLRKQTILLKCYTQRDIPSSFSRKNSFCSNEFNIFFKNSYLNLGENQKGIISLNELNSNQQILLDHLQFQLINCSNCNAGLIFIKFQKAQIVTKRQQISNFVIKNSSCGSKSCFIIINQYQQSYLLNENINLSISQNIEFYISNYYCSSNLATNGTCLNIENANILIQNSEFIKNKASKAGGSIYIQQSILKEQVVLQETIISGNQAQIGGGIYSNSQMNLNFKKLYSIIENNIADFFANDIAVLPSKLKIEVNDEENSLFEVITLVQNDTYKMELFQLKNQTKLHGINTRYYLLPSGIQISQYQYFNWRNRKYTSINFKFRIKALTEEGVEIKDLSNSYCNISSGISNEQNWDKIDFKNTHTSYRIVIFDDNVMAYNLDDLIIYFPYAYGQQNTLFFDFWCNSIFVPKYNKKYPYNLIQQHNSYHLRFQVQTFPCQLGEILNETLLSCQTCDAEKGFFSFNINSIKCEIRDEISTKEVKPAQLNLKANFWRPYFDSSQLSECTNKKENCLGGWIEGDNSCLTGHIGALCEQCDINNSRGRGQYFQDTQYSCLSCNEKREQELYAIFGIMWTLIAVAISVLGSIQSSSDNLQALKLKIIGFRIILKHKPQSILIKIITNYFQILNVLASFQIQYHNNIQTFFYSAAENNLPKSFQCYINGNQDTELMYQIQIWQLIFPLFYMTFFLIFYGIGFLIKNIRFNISVISTIGLYLFIYFQPIMVRNLLSVISYREISGYFWVSANVSYRYDTKLHLSWVYQFFSPAILLFGLLIPLAICFKLFQNRNKLENQKIARRWGYLYNDYNRKAYFWEIFKIIQKELLIFFTIFYEDSIILKCCFIIFLLAFSSQMNLHFKPFNFQAFNLLDYKSGKVGIYSFILLLGIIYNPKNQQIDFLGNLFFTLLIIINSNFIGQLILKLLQILKLKYRLMGWLKNIREKIQQKNPNLIRYFRLFANNNQDSSKIACYYQLLKQYLRKTAIKNINQRKQIYSSIKSNN